MRYLTAPLYLALIAAAYGVLWFAGTALFSGWLAL